MYSKNDYINLLKLYMLCYFNICFNFKFAIDKILTLHSMNNKNQSQNTKCIYLIPTYITTKKGISKRRIPFFKKRELSRVAKQHLPDKSRIISGGRLRLWGARNLYATKVNVWHAPSCVQRKQECKKVKKIELAIDHCAFSSVDIIMLLSKLRCFYLYVTNFDSPKP